jgi:hypothetical protein
MTMTTKVTIVFEEDDDNQRPNETREQNYARAAAVRMAGGSLPDGLAITEIVDGREQVVVKSRGNALRQIQYGQSWYVGRAVKD